MQAEESAAVQRLKSALAIIQSKWGCDQSKQTLACYTYTYVFNEEFAESTKNGKQK